MLTLQFQVRASDGGNPSESITGIFELIVLRNTFAPRITNLPTEINLTESRPVDGSTVFDVNAEDNDTTVSR